MEHRTLGRNGELSVSLLGLGCNNFGERLDANASMAVIDAALGSGVNLLDTAAAYGNGRSEEIIGTALRGRRHSVSIATKFGYPSPGQPKEGLARAAEIRHQVEGSLRRLQTDYIDLYQLHTPDMATPIEETLDALESLHRAGKIRCSGASNFAPRDAVAADLAARALHLDGFACHQNELNLLRRSASSSLLPLLQDRSLGFVPYFPLANGLLSGKYGLDTEVPPSTRLSLNPRWRERYLTPENLREVSRLNDLAVARGITLLELAFGWLAQFVPVRSIIAGAMSVEQVRLNAASLGWRPNADDLAAIAMPPHRPTESNAA